MLVLALPGAADLAAGLASRLHCEHAELQLHHFPDGETGVRIDAPVKGRCVVLAGSLDQPDGKTLPLIFAADAARELGARQVGLVAPYLAYMRQDKRFQPGEAVTSRSYARLLSASLDFLVTVDPHLHRIHSLDEIYTLRTQVVPAAPMIARWLRSHVEVPWLIGPDQESEQWVAEVARLSGAPWTVLAKTRRGDRNVGVRLASRERWPGRTPVLLDDIISTGHTMLAATRLLIKAGLGAPLCIAVHALLDSDAQRELLAAGVTRVVSCDTVVHPTNAIRMASLLARAVRQLRAATEPAP
ncbi:ribose-phosphate pyrophosphokinase [Polaromonas sp. A23]|uniref:ribose-phosphate pyrophosphokinase n=1 Tax=Polaromonas sp. A23 TaxID=1944133 RepID=UPI0009863581|nr:ribose-phosphate pyrophosphokinase [Polaromonas sp. A23]OOG36697.1 phosphoribosylpyrophosphate synthetase [Polaromonas sp. A23]